MLTSSNYLLLHDSLLEEIKAAHEEGQCPYLKAYLKTSKSTIENIRSEHMLIEKRIIFHPLFGNTAYISFYYPFQSLADLVTFVVSIDNSLPLGEVQVVQGSPPASSFVPGRP